MTGACLLCGHGRRTIEGGAAGVVGCWTKRRERRRIEDDVSMPDPSQPALGAAVKAIREQKDISQVALSRATGFTQSWLSEVENGRRNPSWSNVVRLARGLGVSVAELAARAEKRQP